MRETMKEKEICNEEKMRRVKERKDRKLSEKSLAVQSIGNITVGEENWSNGKVLEKDEYFPEKRVEIPTSATLNSQRDTILVNNNEKLSSFKEPEIPELQRKSSM